MTTMHAFIAIFCILGATAGQTTQSGCTCKGSTEVKWRLADGTIGGGFSHYGCGTGPYEDKSPAKGQNWCDAQQSGCNNGKGWDFCDVPIENMQPEEVNVNFGNGVPPPPPASSSVSISVNVNVGGSDGAPTTITTVQGCTCHPTSEVILLQNGVRVGGGFSHAGCGTGPYEDSSPGKGSPWCDTVETWCSAGWDLCVPPPTSPQQNSLGPASQNSYNPLPPLPPNPSPLPQNTFNPFPPQNSFNSLSSQSSYTPPLPQNTFSTTNSFTSISNTGTFQSFFPPPTPFTMPPTPFTMPPTPFTMPPTSFWMPPTPFPQQAWYQPQPYQPVASFQPVKPSYQPQPLPSYQPQPSYQPPQLQPQQYRYTAQPQQPSTFLAQPPKTSLAIMPVPVPVPVTKQVKQVAPPPRSPFTPTRQTAPRQHRGFQRGGGFDYDYDDNSSPLLPLMLLKGASSSTGSSSNLLPLMMMMGPGGLSGSSPLTQFALLNTFREGDGEVQNATSLGEVGQSLGFTRAVVSSSTDSSDDIKSSDTSSESIPKPLPSRK